MAACMTSKKNMSDPLELELHAVLSCHMDTENQNGVLWESNKCPQLLSQLSSPCDGWSWLLIWWNLEAPGNKFLGWSVRFNLFNLGWVEWPTLSGTFLWLGVGVGAGLNEKEELSWAKAGIAPASWLQMQQDQLLHASITTSSLPGWSVTSNGEPK